MFTRILLNSMYVPSIPPPITMTEILYDKTPLLLNPYSLLFSLTSATPPPSLYYFSFVEGKHITQVNQDLFAKISFLW